MRLAGNKVLDSIIFSLLSLGFAFLINRGFYVIDSVVGNEYLQIREATQFNELGRLGHRFLTPVLSKIFPSILFFNIFILSCWLYSIAFNLYEKYSRLNILLILISVASVLPVIFTLNFGNYPDPLTIFISTTMIFTQKNKRIFYLLAFLLVINNEIGLFLLLFFLLISKDLKKDLTVFTLIGITYYIFRKNFIKFTEANQSSIESYISQISDININFFLIFGFFTGLKFTFLLLVFSNKKFIVVTYYLFFLIFAFNMAVDYSRYASLLVFTIIFVLYEDKINKKINFSSIMIFVIFLNIVTPKYYVWDENILYLRDSRIHFLDILGNSFSERNLMP